MGILTSGGFFDGISLDEEPSPCVNCDEFMAKDGKKSRVVAVIDRTNEYPFSEGHAAILVGNPIAKPRIIYDPNGGFMFDGGHRNVDEEVFKDFNFIKYLIYQEGHFQKKERELKEEKEREMEKEYASVQVGFGKYQRERSVLLEKKETMKSNEGKLSVQREIDELDSRYNSSSRDRRQIIEQKYDKKIDDAYRYLRRLGRSYVYIFDISLDDEEKIIDRMIRYEGRSEPESCGKDYTLNFYCTICVSSVLMGIGPFKDLPEGFTETTLGFPTLPNTLGDYLDKFVGQTHRLGGARTRRVRMLDYIEELRRTPGNIDTQNGEVGF